MSGARIRCTPCGGRGRVPWHGTGPWAGKTDRNCECCLGKGWNAGGVEIHIGRAGFG